MARQIEYELVVEGPSEYREGCDYAVREVDGDGEGTMSVAYVDGPEYANLFALAPKMASMLRRLLHARKGELPWTEARALLAQVEKLFP